MEEDVGEVGERFGYIIQDVTLDVTVGSFLFKKLSYLLLVSWRQFLMELDMEGFVEPVEDTLPVLRVITNAL